MRRLLALAALLVAAPALAQQPGDVALVGYRADNPDTFAFVALAPIDGGAEIRFTDNGWQASGSFRANEGTFVYTAPPAGLAPGDVVSVENPAGPALAAAGDQVLVYVGTDAAPRFVYALNAEGDAVWQDDAVDSNTSALPTGLSNGATAVALPELDNYAYTGPTTGTRSELLTAIGDPANWTGDDDARPAFPAAFTVTGDGGNLAPSFTAALTDRDVVAGAPFSFDYDAVDADGDPLSFALAAGPAGATLDAQTGVFSWTPTRTQAGAAYGVAVSVTDGEATVTATAELFVLAEAPNGAPAFSALVYGALVDAGGSVTLDYDAVDPEGGAVTYTLTQTASTDATLDASTGVFSWTAPAGVGVYPFTLTASDGEAASSVDLFVGVRGVVSEGLTGDELRAAVRQAYAPARTLGYDVARDTLYARVSGAPGGGPPDATLSADGQRAGVVCGVYSGFCVTLDPARDPSTDAFNQGINAEHTWPQSRGAGDEPQRSDMHILYPARAGVNSSRGNDPYGEVDDTATLTWFRGAESQPTVPTSDVDTWSERGPAAFEPREAVEGDVARAVLYFAAVYESAADPAFLDAMLSDVLTWDGADPADPAEAQRSGLVARHQGNVNPFVFDATLARRMFAPGSVDAEDGPALAVAVSVYPNPTAGRATVAVGLAAPSAVRVTVYDALGRAVATAERALGAGASDVVLDLSGLPSGAYAVRVTTAGGVAVRRLTVVR